MTVPDRTVSWPHGFRAAASFTFDVDGESAVLATDPTVGRRLGVMSHQAYGPRVGVPRLLRLLAHHGVKSTFFVPGYTALRYPEVVHMIIDDGHEVGHHGFLHEPLAGVDTATQIEYLDRGLDALQKVADVRPVGYRAPMWEITFETPGLLHERGFRYDSSLMDSDVPYLIDVGEPTDERLLVEVPIHWSLDDWEQYCFIPDVAGSGLIESPRKAVQMWTDEYEAMREEGDCFVLTCHPFLSGRPARAAALEELVRLAVEDPDVWVAPLHEIAEHAELLGLAPRRLDDLAVSVDD